MLKQFFVSKWMLAIIVLLAFLLRVTDLTNHPAGFTPDEASFGYDAYSLLHTGKDQWGRSWPLVLESFGDGKMPLYAYISIPSVAIFGLNEFAIRLPNAIFGTLGVLAVYLLTFEALRRKRAAFVAAFLLAVSPWGIAMSRGAFEANLTVFLLPIALYFYLKGKHNSRFFILAAIFAGLNLFTYHAARLVTPLIFMGLIVWDFKQIKKNSWLWVSGLIALAFIVVAFSTYFIGGGSRVGTSSILVLGGSEQRYLTTLTGSPDYLGKIFYNKLTFLGSTFLKNYLSYFSPQFLLLSGPAEATYGMIPGKAVMYLGEAALLVLFVIYLIRNGIKKVNWLILWIVFAVVPAALTIGPGYAANRAVILLPALSIAAGMGSLLIKNVKLLWLILATVIIGFIFAIHSYWYLQPAVASSAMIYGTKDLVDFVQKNHTSYDQIIVSKKVSEPHIYFAFFNKTDPSTYQVESQNWKYKDLNLDWVDQLPEYKLENFVFKQFEWRIDSQKPGNFLFIGYPEEFPADTVPLHKIYSPIGKEIYWIESSSK